MSTGSLHVLCNFDPTSPVSVSDFDRHYFQVPQEERNTCALSNLKISTLYNNASLIQHIVLHRGGQYLLQSHGDDLVHIAIEQGSFSALLTLYKLGLGLNAMARYDFQVKHDLNVYEFAVLTMAYDMREGTQDIARLVSIIGNSSPKVTLKVDDYAPSKERFESQIASAKAKNSAKKALFSAFSFPAEIQVLMLEYAIEEDEELYALGKDSTCVRVS